MSGTAADDGDAAPTAAAVDAVGAGDERARTIAAFDAMAAAEDAAAAADRNAKERALDAQPLTDEELLARHVTRGGVVSSYKSSAVIRDTLEREQLRRAVQQAHLDYDAKARIAAESKEKASREVAKQRELEKQVAALQAELEACGNDVSQRGKARALQKDLASARVHVSEQEQLAAREVKLMNQACKDADYAEMALDRFGDAQQMLETMEAETRRENLVVSKYRAKQERNAALRQIRKERADEADYKMQLEIKAELERNQIAAAKKAHAIAIRRRKEFIAYRDKKLPEFMAIRDAKHQERVRAVFELKDSTKRVTDELRGNVARVKQVEAERKAREKEEFDALLAEGKNPYEVFRRRAQQIKLKADKARLVNRQRKTRDEIAAKMIREERHFVKKDKAERKKKEFAQVYRDSLGRHVTEQRTRDYMLKITKNHEDFVDPTGRMVRIEGSQHTLLKDRSFGLGQLARTRPDVVAAQASLPSMKGVTFSERHAYVVGAKAMGLVDGMGPSDGKQGQQGAGDKFTNDMLGVQSVPGEGLGINEEAGGSGGGGGGGGGSGGASDTKSRVATASSSSGPGAGASTGPNPTADSSAVAALPDEPSFGGEGGKKSRLATRELTVLEKKYLADALERQKGNIVQKQVVWGKEFKGQAFISKPDRIVFKDFEVGKKMKTRITLTNTSFTFNHFKLLSLPDEVKDFFEMTYTKPGRMSAGMTCSILITFDPKVNTDIVSALPLLAQTGPFSIPLVCTTKKIVPSISSPELSLGTVVLGDSIKGKVRITNDGALPTRYRIGAPQEPASSPRTTANMDAFEFDAETDELVNQAPPPGEDLPDVLTFTAEGDVPAYSSVDVLFTFTPRQPGTLRRILEFRFDGSDVVETCDVEAQSLRVPIYVDKRLIDLKCCVEGKLYRAAVKLRNRGNVALQMQTSVPADLFSPDELGFAPPMCYIQGKDVATGEPGSFDVQMKFRPSADTLAACAAHTEDEASGGDPTVITVPLQINVPAQTLPVIFRLRAKLTTSDIEFDPPSIDFGPCFTDRGVSYPLRITNKSALPQKFGFVKMPRGISVPFQQGFGWLLPYESIVRDINFEPDAATEINFSLTFCTYLNRTFKIPCRGRGVKPPLEFSSSLIKLRSTPREEEVRESFFVRNTTKYEQIFDFGVPELELAGITLAPQCAVLKPGQRMRIELMFYPDKVDAARIERGAFYTDDMRAADEAAAETAAQAAADAKAAADAATEAGSDDAEELVAAAADAQAAAEAASAKVTGLGDLKFPSTDWAEFSRSDPKDPGERRSLHATWRIPCCVKETKERTKPRSPRSARAASDPVQPTLILEVSTCTLGSRNLIARVPADTLGQLPNSKPLRLDFGQMAVGQEEVAPIHITNMHKDGSILRMLQPPADFGPFSIVNALRPLGGKGGDADGTKDNMTVYVRFKPEEQLVYCEKIKFKTNTGVASITLAGSGVSPKLELTPADGRIDMGQVLAGDSSTRTFSLRNCSVFPVRYEVVTRGKMPENYNGLASFLCVPEQATIPPGETQEVSVRCQPDHSLPFPHICEMVVRVPTTNEAKAIEHDIHLQARTWARQVFVRPARPEDEPKPGSRELIVDPFAVPPELCVGGDEAAPTSAILDGPRNIRLTFPKRGLMGEDPRTEQEIADGVDITEKGLIVGACDINEEGRTGAGGSFAFRPVDPNSEGAKYFTITPATGAAKPGEEINVLCKFSPPEVPGEDGEEQVCVVVGQWVETTFECALKGGYVPPGCPEEEIVHVTLRGFVVT